MKLIQRKQTSQKTIINLGQKSHELQTLPDDPFSINPDYLFFSDLHLHDRKDLSQIDPNTGLNTRLAEGLGVLDQIIDICKNHPSIRIIFHLGDIFERKDNVPNQILIEFKNRLKIIRDNLDIPFYSLKGNHDFSLPNYPTLFLFGDVSFINVPMLLPNYEISFIPYQTKWEQFEEAWIKTHKTKPSIICIHQDIPGGVYETGKLIIGEWTLKTDPNILYLSGHLHRPQKVHGIQFLGSPYQVRFSDEQQERYIWLYNNKSKQLKQFQLNSAKFVSLNYYDLNDGPAFDGIEDAVKGNYVRIIGDVNREDYDQQTKKNLKTNLEQMGAKVVIFQIKIKKQSQIEIQDKITDDLDIICDYAQKNVVEGLDVSKLIKKGQEIYESL
jgi:DNA repair exonuclease SbcCD nuclease subunit